MTRKILDNFLSKNNIKKSTNEVKRNTLEHRKEFNKILPTDCVQVANTNLQLDFNLTSVSSEPELGRGCAGSCWSTHHCEWAEPRDLHHQEDEGHAGPGGLGGEADQGLPHALNYSGH